MATSKHTAYTASAATALSSELNSLANNTMSAASAAIDNTSTLNLFIDVELVIAAQGGARSAGGSCVLFMTTSLDGTNFDDLHVDVSDVVAVFPLDAATTARRRTVRDVPVPPAQFRLGLRNQTGQAFAASGSTVRFRFHNIDIA
jgi:hypothetical protein